MPWLRNAIDCDPVPEYYRYTFALYVGGAESLLKAIVWRRAQ